MFKSKSLLLILCLVLMILLVVGCGQNNVDSGNNNEEPEENVEETLKIALLLPGSISDMGWNASAHAGLMEAQEKYGAEVTYTEMVNRSDMEEFFRGYALQGYDIIFGHGFEFGDPAMALAQEFPDTKFVITSTNIFQEPNVSSANLANKQQGFIMGAVAGLMTKTNVVGGIGGKEIPPILFCVEGFKLGVQHVNPDAKVLTTMTGSFDDVARAKETALAMIDEGADIIMCNADASGLGSIEACKERGVLAIGSNVDQNPLAPDTVLVSVIKSVPMLITHIADLYLSDNLEPKFYEMGPAEGAVYLSPWHGFEDKVPQEVKDELVKVIEDLETGAVKISDYN